MPVLVMSAVVSRTCCMLIWELKQSKALHVIVGVRRRIVARSSAMAYKRLPAWALIDHSPYGEVCDPSRESRAFFCDCLLRAEVGLNKEETSSCGYQVMKGVWNEALRA